MGWAALSLAAHLLLLFWVASPEERRSGTEGVVVTVALPGPTASFDQQRAATIQQLLPEPHRAPRSPERPEPEMPAQADAEHVPLASEAAVKSHLVRQRLEQYKYYPLSARKRGIEGSVELAFALNASGYAERVRVTIGSGYPLLDRAALETITRANPFPVQGGEYLMRLKFTRL